MVDRMIKGIGVLVMAVAAAASFGLTYWLGKKMIPALPVSYTQLASVRRTFPNAYVGGRRRPG